MSDIVAEGNNQFKMIKVELGDDKEWTKRYDVTIFPDFGVFMNGEYLQRQTGINIPDTGKGKYLLHFLQ